MANSSSAAKRIKQNEKRRLRNRVYKSRVKSLRKKLITSIESKQKDQALQIYRELESLLDAGVGKGVLHRNTVARTKARLHHRVNVIE